MTHRQLASSLLALALLTLAPTALADPNPATAEAPIFQGWMAVGSVSPVVDVPLDGYISLGLQYQGSCADRLGAITVQVTLADEPVPGILAEAAHLSGVLTFQPDAPFEPGRQYAVSVRTNSTSSCFQSSAILIGQAFTTATSTATGPLAPTSIQISRQQGCGIDRTSLQLTSDDAPYVRYDATDDAGNVVWVNHQGDTAFAFFGGTQCVDVATTHVLTGEVDVQTACSADATATIGSCADNDLPFGCSGSTPVQNWPMLAAIAALLALALRRRQSV